MFVRDLSECARTYLTDAYAKVRHYAGKADEIKQKAAVGYQMATPLAAAAADATATASETPPRIVRVARRGRCEPLGLRRRAVANARRADCSCAFAENDSSPKIACTGTQI